MNDELLAYYHQELAFIRKLGAEFAEAHPKIAGRLRLDEKTVEDPHVARLIESFALLNARTRYKLDDDFPELSDALLNIIYPYYLAPIPAMSIVQLNSQKLIAEKFIPKQTSITTDASYGSPCHFRTCYPVTLRPLNISQAKVSGLPLNAPVIGQSDKIKSVLCLRLQTTTAIALASLGIKNLQFYLNAPASQAHLLYELLFNNTVSIAVANSATDPDPIIIPRTSLNKVGFEKEQGILPYEPRIFMGYRLLLEFFALPEKFLFFNLTDLERAIASKGKALQQPIEIYFYFDQQQALLEKRLNADYFKLGCTPIVNLFRQNAEPMRFDFTQTQHPLIANASQPRQATEVYAIQKVVARNETGKEIHYQPFYGIKHELAEQTNPYWHSIREPAWQAGNYKVSGTETSLAFSHAVSEINLNEKWLIHIETLCTNRDLPNHLPFGGDEPYLKLAGEQAEVDSVKCLIPITHTKRLAQVQESSWRLISHLSLNHLSLNDDQQGLASLCEILRLYCVLEKDDMQALLDGLIKLSVKSITARSPKSRANCFWQGSQLNLEVDETKFTGTGLYFFCSILEHFFGLYCSINSFAQLIVTSKQKGEIYRWQPRSSEKNLI